MSAELTNITFFFIFEFFVLFTGIRIIYLITKNIKKNFSEVELVICWIAISLIISSIIPTFFSFLKFNGIWQYLVFSAIICLILHLSNKSELNKYKNFLINTFNNIFGYLSDRKVLLIIGIMLPFILVVIHPTDLGDDLFTMNFAFDWMFNQETPYQRPYNYVAAWEMSFLPSMVITNTDNFLWLNSFKALIIISLGTYLIGKTIKLPKYLIWSSVFSSIIFFQFWDWSLGTLKNDFVFAVGIIFIILSLVKSTQEKLDRFSIIFLIIGFVFLTTKYSGITLGIVAILFFIVLNRKNILEKKKNATKWGTIAVLVFLGTTGHYYIANLLEYSNPLYPANLKILGYELPGPEDWSQSTILANINNENLISMFYPSTKIVSFEEPIYKLSLGGIFFPAIFIFGYLGTASIIIYSIINFVKKKKFETSLFVIASFLFITWIQYLITPFSAGNPEGGLAFLQEIQSIRYVLGSIFVTELLIIGVFWRLNAPKITIISFIAINAASRYLILFNIIPLRFDISLILIPYIMLIGLFFFGKYVSKFSLRIGFLLSVAILIFIFSPQLVEENRSSWLLPWKNISSTIYNLPASEIYLIGESDNWQFYDREYIIKGDKFQHSIVIVTREDLYSILKQENEINKSPEYVAMLCRKQFNCEPELIEFKLELEKYGYVEIAKDQKSFLYKLEK